MTNSEENSVSLDTNVTGTKDCGVLFWISIKWLGSETIVGSFLNVSFYSSCLVAVNSYKPVKSKQLEIFSLFVKGRCYKSD